MYRIIISIFIFSILIGCKDKQEEKTFDFKMEVKKQLQLNVDKITERITAFYVQRYITKDLEYSVKNVMLLQIDPVSGNYVDSLKIELYNSGMQNILDNIAVRKKMIDNLNKRAKKHAKENNTEKVETIQNSIESYENRNKIQQNEYQELKMRDSIVQLRLNDVEHADDIRFFQVDFVIEDHLDHLSRTDTSSLIFNQNHQIEDLLNDQVWDGSFE